MDPLEITHRHQTGNRSLQEPFLGAAPAASAAMCIVPRRYAFARRPSHARDVRDLAVILSTIMSVCVHIERRFVPGLGECQRGCGLGMAARVLQALETVNAAVTSGRYCAVDHGFSP